MEPVHEAISAALASIDREAMAAALNMTLDRYGHEDVATEILRKLHEKAPERFFEVAFERLNANSDSSRYNKRALRLLEVPEFLAQVVAADRFHLAQLIAFEIGRASR